MTKKINGRPMTDPGPWGAGDPSDCGNGKWEMTTQLSSYADDYAFWFCEHCHWCQDTPSPTCRNCGKDTVKILLHPKIRYLPPFKAVASAMLNRAAAAEARLSRNDADSIGSHWDGCWRSEDHHACAVVRIERLEAERDEAVAKRDAYYQSLLKQGELLWDAQNALMDYRTTIRGLCERLRYWKNVAYTMQPFFIQSASQQVKDMLRKRYDERKRERG